MKFRNLILLLAVALIGADEIPLSRELKMPGIYGDGMVLQRGKEIPVFGWAEPGARVTVALGGETKQAVADGSGRFVAVFPPRRASGEPIVLEVAGDGVSRRYENILVGDVWFCFGQSNMEMATPSVAGGAEIVAAARNLPLLRLCYVHRNLDPDEEQEDLRSCSWRTVEPGSVRDFSAIAYLFGRRIMQDESIPVGVVDCSLGASDLQGWMSRGAFESSTPPEVQERICGWYRAADTRRMCVEYLGKYVAQIRKVHAADIRRNAGNSDIGTDDGDWREIVLPGSIQPQGFWDGQVFLFRRRIEIPAAWAGRELILKLGRVTDLDEVYFNGVKIGETGIETEDFWHVPRVYQVPGNLVRAGENLIALRAVSLHFIGSVKADDEAPMELVPAASPEEGISLAGVWKGKSEFRFDGAEIPWKQEFDRKSRNYPGALYNAMVAPWKHFPIRGMIFYQGENNALNHTADCYGAWFKAMIEDYRRQWNDPSLPFLFVQISTWEAWEQPAGYDEVAYWKKYTGNEPSPFAELREAQLEALRLPYTGMALSLDVGEPFNIHPLNKQAVVDRLVLEAKRIVYGQPELLSRGPVFRGMQVEGGAIRVFFDHVGDGLKSADGKPVTHFAVAGEDGVYVYADAVIRGDSVVVSSPAVKNPVRVRYAWSNSPMFLNLVNSAGLPAEPFRSHR